jgi:hypothetical protein
VKKRKRALEEAVEAKRARLAGDHPRVRGYIELGAAQCGMSKAMIVKAHVLEMAGIPIGNAMVFARMAGNVQEAQLALVAEAEDARIFRVNVERELMNNGVSLKPIHYEFISLLETDSCICCSAKWVRNMHEIDRLDSVELPDQSVFISAMKLRGIEYGLMTFDWEIRELIATRKLSPSEVAEVACQNKSLAANYAYRRLVRKLFKRVAHEMGEGASWHRKELEARRRVRATIEFPVAFPWEIHT